VTITVTCYSWAPSGGDHLFTCGAIFWPPQAEAVDKIAASTSLLLLQQMPMNNTS